MTSLSGSKRAQLDNYILVVVLIFIFAVTSIIAYTVYDAMVDAYTDAGVYTGALAQTGERFRSALLFHDWVIIIFMAVLVIGIVLTSYRLATSAAFFIISFFLAAFMGAASYFFNYIFYQIATNNALSTAAALFPNTMILATNLHWVALAVFVLGSIALYAKKQSGGFVDG